MNVTNTQNEYKSSSPYSAYVRKTDEKLLLRKYIEEIYRSGKFAVRKNDGSEHILDVGSGNGINSFFLAKLFDKTEVEGIEPSAAQFDLAKRSNDYENLNFQNIGLEKFQTDKKFDFILVSHVLQYIPVAVEDFASMVVELLNKDGEAWFIQQTRQGMVQIIRHQKKYLLNPRFKKWLTFEDYVPVLEQVATTGDKYEVEIDYLDSSFENIDFANPTDDDKLRLEFMLLLDKPFDQQPEEFKKHLAKLNLNQNGKIQHPNGILKIWKK